MVSIKAFFEKLKDTLKEYWRVLRVTKKPTSVEFKTIVKMSGLGIAIIGLIGFLITMINQLISGGF